MVMHKITQRLNQQNRLRANDVAECDRFFFYGSLMERFHNFNRYIKKRVASIEVGYCRGYLYNLPVGFPGLIVPQQPCSTLVAGEIMQFHNPYRMMKLLDRLENYVPSNDEKSIYIRHKISIIGANDTHLGQQRHIDAWVYTYPEHHLTNEHRNEVRILCGQWKAFKNNQHPVASTTTFAKLNYCNQQQKVIAQPWLLTESVFQKHLTSCHDLCDNKDICQMGQTNKPTD